MPMITRSGEQVMTRSIVVISSARMLTINWLKSSSPWTGSSGIMIREKWLVTP